MNKSVVKDLIVEKESDIYGLGLAAEEYDEKKVRYLRISDIDDNGYLLNNDMKSITAPDIERYFLHQNDLVVARTGNSTGRVYVYDESDGILAYAGFLIKYVFDCNKINPRYMKYYALSEYYKAQIKSFLGSTRGNMNANDFKGIEVIYPDRVVQDKMVVLFDCITNLLRNNSKVCEVMDAIAKTIYDYWFLQYDFPDENGKPYKSSGGEMVWNEELKREIPIGWKVKILSDICEIRLGGTPDTNNDEYWNGNIHWLNSGEVAKSPVISSERTITEKGMKESSTAYGNIGDIVMSITRYIRPSILGINSCYNQSVVAIVQNKTYHTAFLYPFMCSQIERYMGLRTGAQQPHINKEIVEKTYICCPPIFLLEKYYKEVEYLYKFQLNIAKENQELGSLRDFLLPLLMNGQVGFKN